ncbi:MAG: hypothetical protein M3R17_04735 [Bacteroidota bacterium]|nr:hypothetical protein [Bacteroidota bacterium]
MSRLEKRLFFKAAMRDIPRIPHTLKIPEKLPDNQKKNAIIYQPFVIIRQRITRYLFKSAQAIFISFQERKFRQTGAVLDAFINPFSEKFCDLKKTIYI